MPEPTYIIGIDLGTTNSIVAYTTVHLERGQQPEINIFRVPQLIAPSTIEDRDILPSFLFLPETHDAAEDSLELPWGEDLDIVVGEFALNRGAEIPNRLISSSKSWLCHTLVDRNKPILPWEGPDNINKLSPVQASSAILNHIRNAWNYHMAAGDDDLVIENQEILLTVPASFDAVARELTVKAAEMAGLKNITLLEEPQAAFYAWIQNAADSWRDNVSEGDLVLICDVGGGTSDFSLIRVTSEDGDLVLERVAVGNHLLVGGDNMDLSMAYTISNKLAQKGTKLDAWQMRGLWHSCRKAKEYLSSHPDDDSYPVTILGRGSSLIGGTIKTELSKEEMEQVIIDGFFPKCGISDHPAVQQRIGLQEVGLSYESDPAITRHMAQFISRQGNGGPEIPTAIFFNGGVMKSGPVRNRVMDIISAWHEETDSDGPDIREIETMDFDLSVAKGAAYYGITRRGQGVRIRGGLGRSYYIGVAASMPAVPGMPAPVKALCVAPFGMEEGTNETLTSKEFVLVVGEPVKFDLLGSPNRYDDIVGTIVEEWQGDIEDITSIETTLDGEPGTAIPVTIEIKVTEIGTLEFWCVARDSDQKWKLEFNVREKE